MPTTRTLTALQYAWQLNSGLHGKHPHAGGVLVHVVPGQQIEKPGVKSVLDWLRRATTGFDHRQSRRRWRAAATLIFNLGIGIQVGPRVDDLHGAKPRLSELLTVI